jgi:hypothetical protein
MVRLPPTLGKMRHHLIVSAIDSVLVIKRRSQADDDSFESNSAVVLDRPGRQLPLDSWRAGRMLATEGVGHGTKSLRSSPLRGGESREPVASRDAASSRWRAPVLRIEVSSTSLRKELPMSETNIVSPLRQRMLEDMAARKLQPAHAAP